MNIGIIKNVSFKGIRYNYDGTSVVRRIQHENMDNTAKRIDELEKKLSDADRKIGGYFFGNATVEDAIRCTNDSIMYIKEIHDVYLNAKRMNHELDLALKVSAGSDNKYEAQGKENNKAGLSKVAGYNYELNILNRVFINKVKREKSGNINENIPGSILFFGPNRNGKTLITLSAAEETGCDIVKIAKRNLNEDSFIDRLIKTAEKSEEKFKKDRTRTIIFIDEIDKLVDNNKPDKDKFFEFLKTCSKDYHCTVFAATNYPLKLGFDFKDPEIFPVAMSIDPANHKNKKEIIKHYLSNYDNIGEIDIEAIILKLEDIEKKSGCVFSNEQIKNITEDLAESIATGKATKEDSMKFLEESILSNKNSYSPNIIKYDLLKFKRAYDIIIANKGVENENKGN